MTPDRSEIIGEVFLSLRKIFRDSDMDEILISAIIEALQKDLQKPMKERR